MYDFWLELVHYEYSLESYLIPVPKLHDLNQFLSPGKVSRSGCWHTTGVSKRGPSSGCCSAGVCANRGQVCSGPFSIAKAEAGMDAGAAAGECRDSGVGGSGREKVVQSSRKGLHGCRELLVFLRLKDRRNDSSCALRSSLQKNLTAHSTGMGRCHAFP